MKANISRTLGIMFKYHLNLAVPGSIRFILDELSHFSVKPAWLIFMCYLFGLIFNSIDGGPI